jgi:hypothetical protein
MSPTWSSCFLHQPDVGQHPKVLANLLDGHVQPLGELLLMEVLAWGDCVVQLDLHAALRGADLAEGYAVSAVDLALAAIDEAEYAVLDAILAWADADARAARS